MVRPILIFDQPAGSISLRGDMATRAVFVGVNKHRDLQIPELGGARRDATALRAPFTDTLEGLSAHLLLDERATHADVSSAILGALDAAEEDDVIIVGFAGHGSPDGSLVLFDTDAADLSRTALPMAALAEVFERTKARGGAVHLGLLRTCRSQDSGNRPPPSEPVDRCTHSADVAQYARSKRDGVDRQAIALEGRLSLGAAYKVSRLSG